MVVAVAQRGHTASDNGTASLNRGDTLARYRRLREISMRHHQQALKFISGDAILHHARRLGLAEGKTLMLEDVEEVNYIYDLAIHTAPADRSRAIDRYVKSVQLAPGSDEALVLEAMQAARFSILSIERRHEVAGLVATDLFRRTEIWLVDIGLESSVPDRSLMATRLYTPEQFSMTAGVNVPFGHEMIEELATELPMNLRRGELAAVIDDRRFAETIYRVAVANGAIKWVKYQNLPDHIR